MIVLLNPSLLKSIYVTNAMGMWSLEVTVGCLCCYLILIKAFHTVNDRYSCWIYRQTVTLFVSLLPAGDTPAKYYLFLIVFRKDTIEWQTIFNDFSTARQFLQLYIRGSFRKIEDNHRNFLWLSKNMQVFSVSHFCYWKDTLLYIEWRTTFNDVATARQCLPWYIRGSKATFVILL